MRRFEVRRRFKRNLYSFDNNSLLVRFVLAFAVFYGHMFAIYGLPEPTLFWGDHSLGWYAVNLFFVLSGVLVSQSFEYRNIKSYAWARFLRIYPAYVVSLIVSLLFAIIFSQVDYGWQSSKFVLLNLIPLRELNLGLAGAWITSSQPYAMNNSLWTIPFEVFCYIFIVPALLFKKLRSKSLLFLFIIICLLILSQLHIFNMNGDIRYDLLRVIFYYGLGVSFFLWLNKKQSFWYAAVFLLGIAVCEQSLSEFLLEILIISLCLIIAFYFKAAGTLKSDFSYGVYVYAWPVSQVVFVSGVESVYAGAGVAFLCLFVMSYLSWHYIEKPCLRLKNKG